MSESDLAQEHAALLLKKAAQDQFTVEKLLPDPESPDEIIGFHAQQAVEKHLKAVLAAAGVRYGYTHQLSQLIDVVREAQLAFPADLDYVRHFTPFATSFRYDDLPDEPEGPFDRVLTLDLVRRTCLWAEQTVKRLGKTSPTAE